MSLDDIRLQEEIDLAERRNVIHTELIPELEDLIAAAEEAEDDEDAPAPENSSVELRDLRDRLEGQAAACERVEDALGGSVFVIQELMTSETAILTDDVSERSVDVDYEREEVSGSPKQGYHKIRTLELSVVDAPGTMETSMDRELGREVYCVGKLPDLVSDYLYECAMTLNDAGEIEDVGNLSSYGLSGQTSGEN